MMLSTWKTSAPLGRGSLSRVLMMLRATMLYSSCGSQWYFAPSTSVMVRISSGFAVAVSAGRLTPSMAARPSSVSLRTRSPFSRPRLARFADRADARSALISSSRSMSATVTRSLLS